MAVMNELPGIWKFNFFLLSYNNTALNIDNLSYATNRNFVNDIHQKSNQLLTNSQKGTGTVQPVGYDLHVTLNEMKEGLNIVKVRLNYDP